VGGQIYAFGGYVYNTTTYYTCGKYDPSTNTWSSIAPLPTPRIDVAVVACQNKIYVIGGRAAYYHVEQSATINAAVTDDEPLNVNEVYDPATNTWETNTPMPTARYLLQANVVNDKIYVMGGFTAFNHFTNTSEVYDTDTNVWTTAASIPNAAPGSTSVVADNKIYLIGGDKTSYGSKLYSAPANMNEIYDPATDSWTLGNPLPNAISYASASATTGAMATNGIYVIGGYGNNGNPSDLNQVYDPKTNTWTAGLSRPATVNLEGSYNLAIAAVNDKFYLIGGDYSRFIGSSFAGGVFNPPPPFLGINYEYTPFCYGTFNPIPTPVPNVDSFANFTSNP
jgi:N-acetylneuraminic acid mutarotase